MLFATTRTAAVFLAKWVEQRFDPRGRVFEFVIMSNHLYVVLKPPDTISLAKCRASSRLARIFHTPLQHIRPCDL
jgi:hypothetical protein